MYIYIYICIYIYIYVYTYAYTYTYTYTYTYRERYRYVSLRVWREIPEALLGTEILYTTTCWRRFLRLQMSW